MQIDRALRFRREMRQARQAAHGGLVYRRSLPAPDRPIAKTKRANPARERRVQKTDAASRPILPHPLGAFKLSTLLLHKHFVQIHQLVGDHRHGRQFRRGQVAGLADSPTLTTFVASQGSD